MRYNAVVTRVNDPKRLGRIRVRCADLVGSDAEFPFWVEPGAAVSSQGSEAGVVAGWFDVPRPGTVVTLEVMQSHPADAGPYEALLTHPLPRYFPAPIPATAAPDPELTGGKYPERRGYRTPSGHLLVFDDSAGGETITIRHASGSAYVGIAPDGTMTLHAPHVKIDEAADTHLLRGEDVKAWLDEFVQQKYNTHIHPTGVGPSGPPTVSATGLPNSALSANHTVK